MLPRPRDSLLIHRDCEVIRGPNYGYAGRERSIRSSGGRIWRAISYRITLRRYPIPRSFDASPTGW